MFALHVCVCEGVCVYEGESERERESLGVSVNEGVQLYSHDYVLIGCTGGFQSF